MHPVARLACVLATTLAVTTPLVAAADADPAPVPTSQQVQHAKQQVQVQKQSVTQIEAALAAANQRLESASVAAESAAEKYNGAMWRLDVARKQSRLAQARSRRAAADVVAQRSGIVTLVTESYQNGTELNTATALLSNEGPHGLMDRYAVVQSAGDSMQARYERFTAASARAKQYAAKAAGAQKRQQGLAAEAKTLAAAAGQAASAAGAAANQIAAERAQLLRSLARAQHISVELAGRRQRALEEIARQKAVAAAKAKAAAAEAAQQAALQKAAEEAAAKAAQAKKDQHHSTGGSDGTGSGPTTVPSVPAPVAAPPPVPDPAPNASVAVQRVIAYAKAQLGKPYQWAAAGPSTFDCSGLTMQAWARGGVSLPHYSVAQYYQSTPISMADARPGDLLFFSSNGSPSGIHHVALYLGGGQFIEAPHTGANVRYNSISTWYPDFVGRP